MSDIAIKPFLSNNKTDFTVEVPGSKSITNRALLLAALADGKSTLSGVLFSDDSRHFLSCLISLGFRVEIKEAEKQVTIYGEGGNIPNRTAAIDVGSAGTAARFLTALLGLSFGSYHINASEQMKKRPMGELFEALASLGATIRFEEKEGFLPVTVCNESDKEGIFSRQTDAAQTDSSCSQPFFAPATSIRPQTLAPADSAPPQPSFVPATSSHPQTLAQADSAHPQPSLASADFSRPQPSFAPADSTGLQPLASAASTELPAAQAEVTINIDKSSQFLSALLISSCLLPDGITVHVTGSHGMAYIDMTVAMMEQFGVHTERPDATTFVVPGGVHYTAQDYIIEPDMSAACYFYAMAPLLGVGMTVKRIPKNSLQGDIRFLELLCEMGCTMEETADGIRLIGKKQRDFSGVSANLGAFSDQTMTLAAIAPFADSKTTITGIGHIRYQECDRLHAILTELTRLGVPCEELPDGIAITPHTPQPCSIETYNDHRMAMAFSLIGLRVDGIVIQNAECCAKTFENYFEVLKELY